MFQMNSDTDPTNLTPAEQTERFIETAYAGLTADQHRLIWTREEGPTGKKISRSFDDTGAMIAYATEQANQNIHVYCGLATGPKPCGAHERYTTDDVNALVALHADLDIADTTAHKKKNLPRSIDDAQSLLDAMPCAPSIVVHSGHGLQAWWLFDQPYQITDDATRETAEALAYDWIALIRGIAKTRKWEVDSTFDLARVLRMPGSQNVKQPDDIRPVQLLVCDGTRRYTHVELRDALESMRGKYCLSTPVAPSVEAVSGLRADPQARVPQDKFSNLMLTNQTAYKRYYRKDADLEMLPSDSEYDWSLIHAAIRTPDAWTDQELADLIIQRRREVCGENPGDPQAKMNRVGYLARTIARARAAEAQEETELDALDDDDDETEPKTESELEPVRREKKRKAFPDPMPQEAFFGLAGEFVDACLPHTGVSREALLADILARFAAYAGWRKQTEADFEKVRKGEQWTPHTIYGATRHAPLFWPVLVGKSSCGKGDAKNFGEMVFKLLPDDMQIKRESNLSSGEVIPYLIRDGDPIPLDQTFDGSQHYDEGVDDKRLLVFDTEFASVLTVASRPGSILSEITRQAYDLDPIGTASKKDKGGVKAEQSHITFMGHITPDELKLKLSDADLTNGFGNRFVWVPVRRERDMEEPPPFTSEKAREWANRFEAVIRKAHTICYMERDTEAAALWKKACKTQIPGEIESLTIAGKLIQRGRAQCLRLSLIYALLDASATIRVEHVRAALAFWSYIQDGAYCFFGESSGDTIIDSILRELRAEGGMTRTQISRIFSNNQDKNRISHALERMRDAGCIRCEYLRNPIGRGRPIEKWRLA